MAWRLRCGCCRRWPLALLLVTTVANIGIFAEALYLRAHKQEKFMLNSILGALWMAPATLVLGRMYGAYGIAVGYLLGHAADRRGPGNEHVCEVPADVACLRFPRANRC